MYSIYVLGSKCNRGVWRSHQNSKQSEKIKEIESESEIETETIGG